MVYILTHLKSSASGGMHHFMDEGPTEAGNGLIIKKSTKGKSVYSRCSFGRGEFIIEFRGNRYSKEEYKKKLNPKNNHYLQIGDDLYLGPTRTADNYINHSCSPNSGIRIADGKALLYAIRPIKRGEEITFDYSTSMDEDYWEMDCRCGSRNCRKRIRDFKYLPDGLKRKYIRIGIVPEFILKNLNRKRTREISGETPAP